MEYQYSKRIFRVRKFLEYFKIDSIIIYNGLNIQYLTGFDGGTGEGVLAISKDKAVLITDDRYQEAFTNNLPEEVKLFITRDYFGDLIKIVNSWKPKKTGFESTIPYEIFDYIDRNIDSDLISVPGAIEALREIKDQQEIINIEEAAKRSVKAFNRLLKYIKKGQTEKEIADQLEFYAREEGLQKSSFDTIVASGENSAKPHAKASSRVLRDGDFLTIDFGYFFNGYTSDIARTLAIGKPSDKNIKIYKIVKEAQERSINMVKSGQNLDDVDRASRSYISESGYGDFYNHGGGHGIGLDIHEGPSINSVSDDEASSGQVITIEPGIYIPNEMGVRIEDDILVEEDGFKNLTEGISKELISILD